MYTLTVGAGRLGSGSLTPLDHCARNTDVRSVLKDSDFHNVYWRLGMSVCVYCFPASKDATSG